MEWEEPKRKKKQDDTGVGEAEAEELKQDDEKKEAEEEKEEAEEEEDYGRTNLGFDVTRRVGFRGKTIVFTRWLSINHPLTQQPYRTRGSIRRTDRKKNRHTEGDQERTKKNRMSGHVAEDERQEEEL